MSGAHSVLPPSGAGAWRLCAMWPTMNRLYPKGDTPDTLAGNAAHWVAWELAAGRQAAEGMVAPNGIVVTEEMVDGGELMVEVMRSRLAQGFCPPQIEQPVKISAIHPECWGTPDTWAFSHSNWVLEVLDYKFGHRFVDEFENDQGICYTSGILDTLAEYFRTGVGIIDQRITVNFTVVQPRCYYRGRPVRTWTVKAADLRGHINALERAAAEAMGPNPTATTNPECIDCPGRHACPALQRGAYFDAEISERSSPVELTPAAASLELRMLERASERLQARVEGLRESVAAYAARGERVPFHRMERSEGRQKWTIPAEQVVALGGMYGVNLAKPGCVTPKQAITAGVDASVINFYSDTPKGSKLVPENPADVRKVFGNN